MIQKLGRKKKKKKSSLLSKLFLTFLILFLLGILSIMLFIGYYYPMVPPLNTGLFEYSENAIIYDRNGVPYQNLQGEENRQSITFEEIPENVKNAFIAIEDKRFYSHPGVDVIGTARAVYEFILNRNLSGSGGSTITQQLIKQTHLTSERSIERKFDEWILALRLEKKYSKDQILTAYLNKINFHGAEGIQAAAQQYFNKNTQDLELSEIAVLAAIPNSPSYYDPYTYSESKEIIHDENGQIVLNPNNRERAFEVLDKMADQELISVDEAQAAKTSIDTNLNLQFNNPNRIYSYFTDAVYQSVLEDLEFQLNLPEESVIDYIKTSGLKIYSTVDREVQETLENITINPELYPEKSEEAEIASALTGIDYKPEVGITVIDNSDGSVVGMIGGREHNASLTLNRATSKFATGSVTKPITTYGPALEEQTVTLGTVYNDTPIRIGDWQPTNSNGLFGGPTTIRDGLINSTNTIAVQTLVDLGPNKSAEYAKKMGLQIENDDMNASALALGGYTIGQSPEQMAAAYATLARGGIYTKPYLYTKIEDKKGNIIVNHQANNEKVFSPEVSYMLTDVLKQACTVGTASIVSEDVEIAGKTGTTDNNLNAWFCGYSPSYTTAIWYGYDTQEVEVDGNTYALNIGIAGGDANGPAGMFQAITDELNSKSTIKHFDRPDSLSLVEIDKTSGLKPTELTELDPRGSQKIQEIYIPGTEPQEEDDVHYSMRYDTSTQKRAGSRCSRSNVSNLGLLDISKIRMPEGVENLDPTGESLQVYNILTISAPCSH